MKANHAELNTLRIYILLQGYKNIIPIKKKERPSFFGLRPYGLLS